MILFIKYCIVFSPMLFFPFSLRDLPLKVWRVSHLLSHGKVMSFYSQFFLMMASYNMVCHFFVVVFKGARLLLSYFCCFKLVKEKHITKSWPHYQCRWFSAFKSHDTIDEELCLDMQFFSLHTNEPCHSKGLKVWKLPNWMLHFIFKVVSKILMYSAILKKMSKTWVSCRETQSAL